MSNRQLAYRLILEF